jgi:DNA-binding transcriptional MerR regulator
LHIPLHDFAFSLPKLVNHSPECWLHVIAVLHENLVVNESENSQQKAIRLLNRQLEELQQTIKSLNSTDPKFKAWRDTTRGVLERVLGKENHHTSRFAGTYFFSMIRVANPWGPAPPPGYVSPEDRREFQAGCAVAEETLKAAIRDIEDFGVYEEQPKPAPARKGRSGNEGGVTQTFHANTVTIHHQAIATSNAIQKIEHMGDNTGASLKEIANLLQQSEELSPRQVKEGLAHIEAVAVEVQKPEAKRDWKALRERGEAILSLTDKATDLATKIAPYTPAVITLMEQAKHWIR